jgi:hypothetical protein
VGARMTNRVKAGVRGETGVSSRPDVPERHVIARQRAHAYAALEVNSHLRRATRCSTGAPSVLACWRAHDQGGASTRRCAACSGGRS